MRTDQARKVRVVGRTFFFRPVLYAARFIQRLCVESGAFLFVLTLSRSFADLHRLHNRRGDVLVEMLSFFVCRKVCFQYWIFARSSRYLLVMILVLEGYFFTGLVVEVSLKT